MKRQTVNSSHLRSVGYDAASHTLEIEFQTGRIYQYFDVPAEVYDELMAASSHGQYFNANVKGAFSYREMRS